MSERQRQAPDIAAQSSEAQVRATEDTGWGLIGSYSRVLPRTARPFLSLRKGGQEISGVVQMASWEGRARERFQGRKLVTM